MSSIKVTMKSKKQINVSLTRLDSALFLQKSVYDPDADGALDAGIIAVNTENFTGNLSSADDNLQKALETLDQLTGTGSETAEWGTIGGTLSNQIDLQTALDGKASISHSHTGVYESANSNIQSHISSTSNPHSVTASQVGLGNVSNVNWGAINAQTDNYTLQPSDNGKVITVNKATGVTITIPDTLTPELSCSIIQLGTGQVTFVASGSMSINHRQSHTKIAGQYGVATLYAYASNNVLLAGDTTT